MKRPVKIKVNYYCFGSTASLNFVFNLMPLYFIPNSKSKLYHVLGILN